MMFASYGIRDAASVPARLKSGCRFSARSLVSHNKRKAIGWQEQQGIASAKAFVTNRELLYAACSSESQECLIQRIEDAHHDRACGKAHDEWERCQHQPDTFAGHGLLIETIRDELHKTV
jgi:hypothetical protein